MADNFRHAQYREDGTQIDDPQKVSDLNAAENLATRALVSKGGIRLPAAANTVFTSYGVSAAGGAWHG